jgi:hypothetical protein
MSGSPNGDANQRRETIAHARAIFTDNQFWIPVIALLLGIGLLIYLH